MYSSYDYFCVAGAEGRKKWTDDEKRRGACGCVPHTLTLLELATPWPWQTKQ